MGYEGRADNRVDVVHSGKNALTKPLGLVLGNKKIIK